MRIRLRKARYSFGVSLATAVTAFLLTGALAGYLAANVWLSIVDPLGRAGVRIPPLWDAVLTGAIFLLPLALAFLVSRWVFLDLRWVEVEDDRSCRACGYNLTGNVSGRCPECGETTEIDRA